MNGPINKREGIDPDIQIRECLDEVPRRSFFVFAGAGSGKTGSLVKALKWISEKHSHTLRLHGQRVAVITYTNKASEEITHRLEYDPLFAVSTIHSFIWQLIQGLTDNIRAWMQRELIEQQQQLKDEQARQRNAASKTATERVRKLNGIDERLQNLPSVVRFRYSPESMLTGKDTLNHTQVIQLGAYFLAEKKLMQRVLVGRFPILFVDESQDTQKDLMSAFLKLQQGYRQEFCLGLFGDMEQRIYTDGLSGLGVGLPDDWRIVNKEFNYRSPLRVVNLINQIRAADDGHTQQPSQGVPDGWVRLFVVNRVHVASHDAKLEAEKAIAARMAEITGDSMWRDGRNEVKKLVLEHKMAARRLGFLPLFEALCDAEGADKNAAIKGTESGLTFLFNTVRPLYEAGRDRDLFRECDIATKFSPLLSRERINEAGRNQVETLRQVRDVVRRVGRIWNDDPNPPIYQVVKAICDDGLFEVPAKLQDAVIQRCGELNTGPAGNTGESSTGDPLGTPDQSAPSGVVAESPQESSAGVENETVSPPRTTTRENPWTKGVEATWDQVLSYCRYVEGRSEFDTHQGVKGLEFDRVMVVIDDGEAGGFLFSYEKLFGAAALSATDQSNANQKKETSVDRTRRLFYVTCSRARKALAIVAYSSDPDAVVSTVKNHGWFSDGEVIRWDA